MKLKMPSAFAAILFCILFITFAHAQTTSFTYQGRLTESSLQAGGTYDFEFVLYDSAGNIVAVNTTTTTGVQVANGIFTVKLDFGSAAFPGATRNLEIRVKKPAEADYTPLAPRQQITSAPYSIRALSASTADNATNATNADNAANATNATTATTALNVSATSGDSVVNAVNNAATTQTINSNRLASDILRLNPSASQTFSAASGVPLIDITRTFTGGNGSYRFRMDNENVFGVYTADTSNLNDPLFKLMYNGGLLIRGDYDGGALGNVPWEGSGTRMVWYPGKAAFRAGRIDGTQWDDANIGLFSVAFGENTRALGDNAFAMGKSAVAAGSRTVAMGEGVTATGYASVALGYGASTSTAAGSPRVGTFVFSDFSVPIVYSIGSQVDSSSQFHPTVTNSFNVRAVNGSFFYTNTALTTGLTFNSTTANLTLTNSRLQMSSDGSTAIYSNSSQTSGVTLPAGGGTWNSVSDRNMKENFQAVDTRSILQKVLSIPVSTWNYKTQDKSIRHIGAMAQDFYALFNVGDDDKHISTIDPDGVALAAIQGLYEELKDRDAKIAEQEKQLKEQNQKLSAFEQQLKQQQLMLENLKKTICAANTNADVCKQ